MATLHITPTGSGKKDGSSVENAASVWQLDKMVEKAGAGGTVLLHADMGAYNIKDAIKIMHGGTDGQPVTIKGVDAKGHAKDVEIVGTRAADYSPTGAKGTDIFRLLDGADNLKFENMSFKNVQNAFRVGDDVSNISVSHMEADNVQRFFENYASTASGKANISGLLIDDVEIHGFSKGAVRLQYDTHDVVIRNVRADSERQDGDNFAIGVHLGDTVHNVLIKNTSMMNATDTIHRYWNGDGFATEADVYNVRFEDTYAAGNTDGGYDLKSSNTVLLRAVAEDNNRNFRIWGDGVTIIDSESINPNHRGGIGGSAHVHLASNSTLTITGSTMIGNGGSTFFDLTEKNADVILVGTEVYASDAGKLAKFAWGSSLTNADGTSVKIQPYDAALADAMKLAVGLKAMQVPVVPATFDITPEASSITEGDVGSVRVSFTVTRSGDATKAAGLDWAVQGFGANAANGADFKGGTLPLGHLSFAAGETSKIITVEIQSDKLFEANETFKVVLSGATNGTIKVGSADVVINNDDAMPKVVTILDKAHSIDLSSSANQTVTGAAYHNSYYVDVAANSGKDVVTSFGRDDVLLTTKALFDSDGDGVIKFSKTSTVGIDGGAGSKDTITLSGDTDGLRLLGKTDAGLMVYAHSDVRPVGAIEGKLSDDVLMGSGTIKKPSTFFFDTGLDLDFGHDIIKKFGAKDLLVTTSEIASVNGKIAVDQSGSFALPGATGSPDDSYIAGEGGHVGIFDVGGAAVTTLEHDGAVTHEGVTYHVYSMVGSSVGVSDLHL